MNKNTPKALISAAKPASISYETLHNAIVTKNQVKSLAPNLAFGALNVS